MYKETLKNLFLVGDFNYDNVNNLITASYFLIIVKNAMC